MRPTRSNISVRTSNTLCSLYNWVHVTRPFLAYKYATKFRIDRPSPSLPSSVGTTTVTQWRRTAYTNMLKSVGGKGSAWVTPRHPLNGSPKYPLALATMVSWPQYYQRSRIVLGPTPYAARISRHLSQSRAFFLSFYLESQNLSHP